MFCLFHFPDGGGSRFKQGLDLLGHAGDNPHVIGTGMEKRSETSCHQFLLKILLEISVITHIIIIIIIIIITIIYYFFGCVFVYADRYS